MKKLLLFLGIWLISSQSYAEVYIFREGCYESFVKERGGDSLLEELKLEQVISVTPVSENGYDQYMPPLEVWSVNKKLESGDIHAIGILPVCSKVTYHLFKEDGLKKNFDDFLYIYENYATPDLVIRYSKGGYKAVVGFEKAIDLNRVKTEGIISKPIEAE